MMVMLMVYAAPALAAALEPTELHHTLDRAESGEPITRDLKGVGSKLWSN